MRVLYFTGAYRDDSMVSHSHGDLVAALRARGVAMEMLTFGPSSQPAPIERRHDHHGTTVTALRVTPGLRGRARRAWSSRRWAFAPFLGATAALRGFFTPDMRARFDLVHVGMVFPYATMLRHALDTAPAPPALVTITGGDILVNSETGYGYGRTPHTRAAIADTLRWAALVQANSPHSAMVAATEYGCPRDRIAVRPPHSPIAPTPRDAIPALRRAAHAHLVAAGSIPPGRLLFGLGRMEGIKGYDDAIRALPAILATAPDVTALFAGPARSPESRAYAASLADLAASLGVASRVVIRPEIPFGETARYFAAADLVLIPSLMDGLNKTGIEGASVGTPAVVSRAAGLVDYVEEFGAGAVVPPRDPAALAAAVSRLLTNHPEWDAASQGARTMAEHFSLDHTTDGVLALYKRILSR